MREKDNISILYKVSKNIACSHGARHVIHISPGAVFRSGHFAA